jgi:predicted ATP-binding protein involved in virulence
MWLKTAVIKNFRGIENLPINFDKRANVIVGPNAIGKTTLLEAIRLVKGVLSPRTPDETQQVFQSLGAIVPQNPTRFNYTALARDPDRAVEIDTAFALTQEEAHA